MCYPRHDPRSGQGRRSSSMKRFKDGRTRITVADGSRSDRSLSNCHGRDLSRDHFSEAAAENKSRIRQNYHAGNSPRWLAGSSSGEALGLDVENEDSGQPALDLFGERVRSVIATDASREQDSQGRSGHGRASSIAPEAAEKSSLPITFRGGLITVAAGGALG